MASSCGRFKWSDITRRVIERAKKDAEPAMVPRAEAGGNAAEQPQAEDRGVPEGETLRIMLRTLADLPPTAAPDGPVFFEAGPPWGEV